MHKIYITAMLLAGFTSVKASSVRDSIGVENNNGKKIIIHQTVAKETYYSIARRYNVLPKDIMTFNDNKFLQIGLIIKVPTDIPFSNNIINSTSVASEYTVQAKDNLSAIANKFGTTINDLKALNNLTTNNLRIGQVLKVPTAGNAITPPVQNSPSVASQTSNNEQKVDETIVVHIVKAQEYLNKIAELYGTTVEKIKSLNNLTTNSLKVGQLLKIPATKNIETVAQNTPIPTITKEVSDGTHLVKEGETIYTIAQKYSITAYQIRTLNNLIDNNIKIGQSLKLPSNVKIEVAVPKKTVVATTTPSAEPAAVNNNSAANSDQTKHTVLKGENIFTIAQKYGLTAYQLREANNLTNNTIKVDQELNIPKKPEPKGVNEVASNNDMDDDVDGTATLLDPKLKRDASAYGINRSEEKGAAMWIADEDLDSSKMLVLHRTLPVGRVIRITNPMTNRTTFAKVVGKFTENESTKDLILVMTKAVAESLGALDKRFFCNIVY